MKIENTKTFIFKICDYVLALANLFLFEAKEGSRDNYISSSSHMSVNILFVFMGNYNSYLDHITRD